jgi:hypothetical protein
MLCVIEGNMTKRFRQIMFLVVICIVAGVISCETDDPVEPGCKHEREAYVRVIFGPHPSCFSYTYYAVTVMVKDDNDFHYFEPYFTQIDTVTGYRQSDPVSVTSRNDTVECYVRYQDKGPSFDEHLAVLIKNSNILNIYLCPDTINSCSHYNICGDYVSFNIDARMACTEADSVFVTWNYLEYE